MTTTIENVSAKVSDYDRNFYGYVLSTSENNGYHDSDFFATVWDDEQGCVRTIEDGTTRFAAPSKYNGSDASVEVREKARAWWAATVGPKQGYNVLMGQRLDAYYRSYGLTYALPARAFRLGLRLEDGTRVFTSMENVAKLGVVEPTQAEISQWVKWNNPYAYNGKDGKMVK